MIAISVIADREDDIELVTRLRAVAARDRHLVIAITPRPTHGSVAWDVLRALGKRADLIRGDGPAWSHVRAWLHTNDWDGLLVLRAHHLTPADLDALCGLTVELGLELRLVDHGPQPDAADVVASDPSTGQTEMAINLGGELDGAEPLGAMPASSRLRLADVDGDTDVDLVSLPSDRGAVRVRTSEVEGLADATDWATIPAGADVAVADVDRDDAADLLVRPASSGDIRFESSTGSRFATPRPWSTLSADHELNFVDLTADDSADAVGRHRTDGSVSGAISDLATRTVDATVFAPESDLSYADEDESVTATGTVTAQQAPPPPPRACSNAKAESAPTSTTDLAWSDDGTILSPNADIREKAVQRIVESGAGRVQIFILVWRRVRHGRRRRHPAAAGGPHIFSPERRTPGCNRASGLRAGVRGGCRRVARAPAVARRDTT